MNFSPPCIRAAEPSGALHQVSSFGLIMTNSPTHSEESWIGAIPLDNVRGCLLATQDFWGFPYIIDHLC